VAILALRSLSRSWRVLHWLLILANASFDTPRVHACSEVPFVWHDGETLLGDGELELGTAISNYWTNFAATGNPNVRKIQRGALLGACAVQNWSVWCMRCAGVVYLGACAVQGWSTWCMRCAGVVYLVHALCRGAAR